MLLAGPKVQLYTFYAICQYVVSDRSVIHRELAQQIQAAARPLKRLFGLSSLCLYGGVDKLQQVGQTQPCQSCNCLHPYQCTASA